MKKHFLHKTLFLLFAVCFLTGCAQNNTELVNGDATITPVLSLGEITLKRNDAIKELYPEKTVLVYLLPRLFYDQTKEQAVYKRFNELLSERGYDFVVDFVTMECEEAQYLGMVNQLKEQGTEVDLFNTGPGYANGSPDLYMQYIQLELLSPLTQFFNKPEGKPLYQSMDKLSWGQVSANGEIYGVASGGIPKTGYYWLFNQELAEKYDIDLSAFQGTDDEVFRMIDIVQEGEKANDNLILFTEFNDRYTGKLAREYQIISLPFAVAHNDVNRNVVNIYQEKGVIAYLQKLAELSAKGLYKREYSFEKQSEMECSFFTGTIQAKSREAIERWLEQNFTDEVRGKITLIPGKEAYVTNVTNAINGITTWTKQKEKAFQLLTLLFTDEEFCTALIQTARIELFWRKFQQRRFFQILLFMEIVFIIQKK